LIGESDRRIDSFDAHSSINFFWFTKGMIWLVAACQDGRIIMWETRTKTPVILRDSDNIGVKCVYIASDDKLMAFCGEHGLVSLIDLRTFKVINTYEGHEKNTVFVSMISPDITQIATSDEKGVLIIYDLHSGKIVYKTMAHKGFFTLRYQP
jgi:WD40 repeat protein